MFENNTLSELVLIYNSAANEIGEKTVKKFSDKKSAVRRAIAITERLTAVLEERAKEVVPAPAKPARRFRTKRFVFKPDADIRPVKGNGSLREQCIDLLKVGAKFEDVEGLVAKFDQDRGKETVNLERRAYELVRIMHYYFGFGIRHDVDGDGTIQIYTN